MTYEHPKWPPRHKPNITTAELGAKVTCLCGWSASAPNRAAATRVYLDHRAAEKGGGVS